MKVFVAVSGYDYEGWSDPVGVYSTREKAQAALRSAEFQRDNEAIVEYDLDDAPAPQARPEGEK